MDAKRWFGLLCALATALTLAAPAHAGFDEATGERQNAGRTGFVPGGTLDQPPLTQRWSRELGTSVILSLGGGGRVFAVVEDSAKSSRTLYALDALSGATSWFRPIGSYTRVGYGGGRVFVHDGTGAVTAIDASSGSTDWIVAVPTGAPRSSPIYADGTLYTILDDYSDAKVTAIDPATGAVRWQAPTYSTDAALSVDARNVYVNNDCTTSAYVRGDGRKAWTRTPQCSSSTDRVASDGALVFSATDVVDSGTATLRDQHFGFAPAVAGSVSVTLNGSVLQARSTRTGAGLWEYRKDGTTLRGEPLVVNHTVYTGATDGRLLAVDLRTGQEVWSTQVATCTTYSCSDAPGQTGLAAAQGLLLVPYRGRLVAYDDGSALPRPGLDLQVLSGPGGPVDESTVTFTFGATGTGFTTRCRLDRGAWTACAGAITYPEVRDGPHVFEVETVDGDGQTVALAARGFSVVTGRPATTITSGPAPYSNRTRMCAPSDCSFYTSYEPGVRFKTMNATASECRLDTAAWTPCTDWYAPSTSTVLTDGPHAIEVRSFNSLGVVESPPERHEWIVDTKGPKVTYTSKSPSPGASTTGTVEFVADEPGSTFTCRLSTESSSAATACTSPYTRTVTNSGSYTFYVRATDRTGNAGTETSTGWIVEPDTEITSGPATETTSQSARFTFRDRLATSSAYQYFSCRLDGGAWASCSSGHTWSGLSVGPHAVDVKARLDSSSGVEDQSPARWEWVVTADVTPPETTITNAYSPGPGAARLAFTSSEPGTFACRVDGGTWTSCQSPVTFTGLSGGTHTFSVRATDVNANTDPTPAGTMVYVEDPPAPAPAPGPGSEPDVAPVVASRTAEPAPQRSSGTVIPIAPAPSPAPARPVTAAQLQAALPATPRAVASALALAVAGVDARSFARDEELLVGFAPARAGRLTVELVAVVRGRRVVVARGARRFAARESAFVSVRATAAGRRLLRRSSKVRLSVSARFGVARGSAKATMARR